MKWIDFKDKRPPPYTSYFAKSSKGWLFLCSHIGNYLEVTDEEQWQYTFKYGEIPELRGEDLKFWLDEGEKNEI